MIGAKYEIDVAWGDHLWQKETTYGTIDGPQRPTVAAIHGLEDHQ